MVSSVGLPMAAQMLSPQQFIHWCLQGRWNLQRLHWLQVYAHKQLWRDVQDPTLFWQAVYQLAQQENLLPLLYGTLRHRDILPPEVEQAFSAAYYSNACRNSLLLRELTIVLQRFHQQGIPVLVMKGAALAEAVYRDIALRPMSDLDLLIQPSQLAQARYVLADLGYALTGMELHTGYTEEFRSEETWCRGGVVQVAIDLHWGLLNRLYYQQRLPSDWLWATAQPIQIEQTPALTFCTNAQILYLSAHLLLHHDAKGWLWFQDIAEIIALNPDVNWVEIFAQAQAYKLVTPLQRVIAILAHQWNVSIPTAVLGQLARLKPSPEEAQVIRYLETRHLGLSLRLFLADLLGATDWRHRLRFAWNTLFPTRAYMQQRYKVPKGLPIWLYYPYRWLRAFRP